MKIKLCASVAGGETGDEVEVADEYGTWLVSEGYAVHTSTEKSADTNTHNEEDQKKNDDEKSSSSRTSQKRSSQKR